MENNIFEFMKQMENHQGVNICGVFEPVPDLFSRPRPLSNSERLEVVETHLVTAARIAAVRLNTAIVDQDEEGSVHYMDLIHDLTSAGNQLDKWMRKLANGQL